MNTSVTERAEILKPNIEHKSFSGTNTFIEKGKKVTGEPKIIHGLRKGKPFDYRLFELKNDQFIHLNKVNINQNQNEEMKNTEVKLGADASGKVSPGELANATKIDTAPKGFSLSSHPKLMGAVVGAIVGFAYSHTMKHENKKKAMYAGAAALVGIGIGAYIEHRRAIVITPSK